MERKKKRLKYLVLGPGSRRTLRLSSRTPLGYNLTSCIVHTRTNNIKGTKTFIHKRLQFF